MAYRLKDCGDVSGETQRIIVEQIDRAVGETNDAGIDAPTAIHQVRKRCKKIRAVLRLARGPLEKDDTYAMENAWYRDLARRLAAPRDAEVLIQTHDALVEDIDDPDIKKEHAAVRERLLARRERLAAQQADLDEHLRAARAALVEGRGRVAGWAWRVRNFKGLEPGFKRTYRRGRRAMHAAYQSLTPEDFHDWRKRVKYHWYACRLLRDVWPAEMDARCGALSRLSDLLGNEHDLSVYHQTLNAELGGDHARLPEILAAAEQRRTRLRREARPQAMRLYAEKPAAAATRVAGYWQAWRAERQ